MVRKPRTAAAARALGARATAFAVPSALAARLVAERDRWVLWLPVALGLGIAAYYELRFEPEAWWGWALAILAAPVALWPGLAPGWRATGYALCAAGLGFALAAERTAAATASVLARAYGPAPVEGRVIEASRLPEGKRVVLDRVKLRGVAAADTPQRVRVSLSRPGEPVSVGDRIVVMAMLSPPSGPAAPGAFDFQRMAWYQKLGGIGYAVGPATVQAREPPAGFVMALGALRARLTDRIVAALGGNVGGMAAALLTGDQTALDKEAMQAMRDSGLAHLLSISGLHIAFVAALVMGAVRYGLALFPSVALRLPVKKIAAAAALVAAFLYMLLAGAPVPAQRSFLMAGLVLLAVILDRTALSMRLVAWAAAAILLIEPESLTGASFQMSFAAVTALIAAWEAGKPLRARLRLRYAGIEDSLWSRAVLHLGGVLFTTLVAGTATAAFSAYHFNRVSLLGTVANLLAVPLTGIWVMPWGVLALLLAPFGLEGLPLVPMGWGIEGILWIAREVASWPGAAAVLPSMPGISLWLIVGGGLWLCLWQTGWRWWGLLPVAAAFALTPATPVPDIQIAESARLVGVRGTDGRLLVSIRGERFVADIWARRAGLEGSEVWPRNGVSADGSVRCDAQACTYRNGLWRTTIVATPQAVERECERADVLISLVPVPQRCTGPRFLVERRDILRDGAHAIRFEPTRIVVDTVRARRGERPWTPKPPP